MQQLAAPIALYPDGLVAQILAAATYPDQVVEAETWLEKHKNLTGDKLAKEVNKQHWDPVIVPGSGLEPLRKLPSQEKEIIEAALSESGGRVYGPAGAAAKLGIPRSTLEHKIRSLKINKNHFKTAVPP